MPHCTSTIQRGAQKVPNELDTCVGGGCSSGISTGKRTRDQRMEYLHVLIWNKDDGRSRPFPYKLGRCLTLLAANKKPQHRFINAAHILHQRYMWFLVFTQPSPESRRDAVALLLGSPLVILSRWQWRRWAEIKISSENWSSMVWRIWLV